MDAVSIARRLISETIRPMVEDSLSRQLLAGVEYVLLLDGTLDTTNKVVRAQTSDGTRLWAKYSAIAPTLPDTARWRLIRPRGREPLLFGRCPGSG